jgi:ureidoacrylate peracid hydrolase
VSAAALLVIDMQNGFIHPDGSLPAIGQTLPRIADVIRVNAEAIRAARDRGLPVMYTRHVFREGMRDQPQRMRTLLPEGFEMLIHGTWDGQIHDDLAPVVGEAVIDKNRFDAFLYTDLEVQLQARGIRRVVVTGVLTSVCVESTVRSGEQRDFDMYVASDCVSAPDPFHESSLATMSEYCATILPFQDALAALS